MLFLFQSYETKKKGVGKVEEKQAILHEEGKMDDGLDFSRSQEEESRTARVIRKCSSLFTNFITYVTLVWLKNENRTIFLCQSNDNFTLNSEILNLLQGRSVISLLSVYC